MWFLAQKISFSEVEHADTMRETLQSVINNLILISGIFLLAASLLLSSSWDGIQVLILMACILLTGSIFFLANYLQRYNNLAGLMVWMLGIALAVLAGCWLTQMPGLVLLSVILPLIAAITISSWAGLAMEGLVVALVLLVNQPFFGGPLPHGQAGLITGAAAFIGLMGWATSRELLNVSLWSMTNFDGARQKLNEVRERHLEMLQAQEDLSLANNELARLSNRLKALEQIAEDARQATTEFVANVSHELRTPLNMIIGYADMISRSPKVYGGRLPPSLMTDITAILRNAQHLYTLVNDVLDLSQVEAGRMAISRSWASIDVIVQEAITAVHGLFESRGLYLKSEIPTDIPPIYMDEIRIRQVIINLLSNAGRFTEQGGVILRCELAENKAIIHVYDTGPGIAEKDQERIFEPFQQADTSIRRRYGGSGLGLTISKQFIEMHGGKMWLESEPGVGTVFSFSLPVGSPAAELDQEAGHNVLRSITPDDEAGYHVRSRRSKAPPPSTSERYVIVDQEHTLQHLLAHSLPGVNIESLPDIPSAVEALHRSPAQALILNQPRPETAHVPYLTDLPYGTPAITCWLPGKQDTVNRLGLIDYLIKPLARESLLATLEKLQPVPKTILIVDDEEDELHLFARYLETGRQEYSILQVTNGQRALAMLRTRKPDVMLLDLTMPGMDGFQVLEEKRRDPQICAIPVIVISSKDPAGDPIVSDTFMVTQSGGFSQRNLITCIQALGEILAPSVPGD